MPLTYRPGDLAEVAAVSRWGSLDDIGKVINSDDYDAALAELGKLFVQSPFVRHYERVE